ncbi:MAG: branched-chain amino acid ABC transporter permease [Eubacteriales bacterium]|nr:branched-chain amino acid ABC transporter permease [Eubacteriales bacterium]
MYIDADTIIKAAALLTSIGSITAVIVAVIHFIDRQKLQDREIAAMREEQTLICYGLRGCLQGLIEQGCNGPCKDALNKLDKHLNKAAHSGEDQ